MHHGPRRARLLFGTAVVSDPDDPWASRYDHAGTGGVGSVPNRCYCCNEDPFRVDRDRHMSSLQENAPTFAPGVQWQPRESDKARTHFDVLKEFTHYRDEV